MQQSVKMHKLFIRTLRRKEGDLSKKTYWNPFFLIYRPKFFPTYHLHVSLYYRLKKKKKLGS